MKKMKKEIYVCTRDVNRLQTPSLSIKSSYTIRNEIFNY